VPKGYWISTFRLVADRDRFAEYVQRAVPLILAAGGRFLVKGMPTKVYEVGLDELTVVIEFDSPEAAIATYESPAYQEALATVREAVERDIRIVAGVE
jgi:uncharacterized protein (DUF1330 family)